MEVKLIAAFGAVVAHWLGPTKGRSQMSTLSLILLVIVVLILIGRISDGA